MKKRLLRKFHTLVFIVLLCLFVGTLFLFRLTFIDPHTILNVATPESHIPLSVDNQLISIDDQLISLEGELLTTQSKPIFTGQTSVPESFVAFRIENDSLQATHTCMSDEEGIWQFRSEDALVPGSYLFSTVAKNEQEISTTNMYHFAVQSPSTPIVFQEREAPYLYLHLDPEQKKRFQGDDISFSYSASHTELPDQLQVVLYNEDFTPVFSTVMDQNTSQTAKLTIPPSTPEGTYLLSLSTASEGILLSSSNNIRIIYTPKLTKFLLQLTSRKHAPFIFLLLSASTILILLLLLLEAKKISLLRPRKRKHNATRSKKGL